MEKKHTASTASKKIWMRWLSICLILISAAIAISLLILSTTIGARFALRVAARQSPVPILIGDVRGTLLTGVHIRQIKLNQSIIIDHIDASWTWDQQLIIKAQAKTAKVSNIPQYVIDALPEALHAPLKQTTQLHDALMIYNASTSMFKITSEYLGQTYTINSVADKPSTLIITSGHNKKLFISLQQKEKITKTIFAHGAINLHDQNTFFVDQGEVHIQANAIDATISGHSKDKKNRLYLHIQNDPQLGNRIHFDYKTPTLSIHAGGTLGQDSQFIAAIRQSKFQINTISGAHSHLDLSITGDWQQPKIKAVYSAQKLQSDNVYVSSLQAHYDNACCHLENNNLGALSLKIQSLILEEQEIRNIHVKNSAEHQYARFHIHAEQGKQQIDGIFKVKIQAQDVSFVIEKATIDQYELFREDSPQKIHFNNGTILFKSQNHGKQIPMARLDGIWQLDGKVDLNVQIHDLRAQYLPLGIIRQYIPQLESISGSITAEVKIRKTSSENNLNPQGHFIINIQEILFNQLIENLPIDSSLTVTGGTIKGTIDPDIHMQGTLQTKVGPISISLESSEDFKALTANIEGKNIVLGQDQKNNININTKTTLSLKDHIFSTDSHIDINHATYRLDFFRPVSFLPFETIIHKKNKNNQNSIRYKFNAAVNLGQNTNVHVTGFHGLLRGNLKISGSESTPTTVNGAITLNQGTLVIYKQSLPIDRMIITWFNSPIETPDINLRIMTKSLRTIDGRDQMQQFGLRAHGAINNIQFDYFSSPAPMNSFQIITALLTDSSFSKKANKESLDKTLAYFNSDQKNNQITEILEILNAIKNIPFFDNIDISEIDFNNADGITPDITGITITKRLDKKFSIRYRISPSNQRNNRVSLDTNITDSMILTNFIQNEGDIGVAINYSGTR